MSPLVVAIAARPERAVRHTAERLLAHAVRLLCIHHMSQIYMRDRDVHDGLLTRDYVQDV